MAQTLTAPLSAHPAPLAEGPALRLWTREEYHRMAQAGILEEGPGTELIEGLIYRKMSQGRPHILAVKLVFWALHAALGDGYDLSMQTSLPLGDHNEPEPDILVLRGEARDYEDRDPDPANDVILAVEVSDSTLQADRTSKVSLYARFGIPEYWIIDVQHRTLEIRRRPFREGYAETLVLMEQQSVTVGNGVIRVADVLPKSRA